MNRANSVSQEDIFAIFQCHKLANNPKVERINIGFTNEVYRVDECILKLYLRPDGRVNFDREARLYKSLESKALTPKLILSNGSLELVAWPYIIYERIEGEALGSRWHMLNDLERREIIKTLCEQIRLIAGLESHPELGRSWRSHMKHAIDQRIGLIEEQRLLPAGKIRKIRDFVEANIAVLNQEVMGLIYWDVLLDNIIVRGNKMVGLVDLEHVDVVSLDYLLNNVSQMVKYPDFTLSPEMKAYGDTKDYTQLLGWFREFYPELFAFEDLEKRLALYELEEVLRFIPRFIDKSDLQGRLEKILNT